MADDESTIRASSKPPSTLIELHARAEQTTAANDSEWLSVDKILAELSRYILGNGNPEHLQRLEAELLRLIDDRRARGGLRDTRYEKRNDKPLWFGATQWHSPEGLEAIRTNVGWGYYTEPVFQLIDLA